MAAKKGITLSSSEIMEIAKKEGDFNKAADYLVDKFKVSAPTAKNALMQAAANQTFKDQGITKKKRTTSTECKVNSNGAMTISGAKFNAVDLKVKSGDIFRIKKIDDDEFMLTRIK